MNQIEVEKANKLYDSGKISELYNFIEPFLKKDDPYALYFSARFSLSEEPESAEEFDQRYIKLLIKAAEGNVPEAMYRLSGLYFVGDIVELNVATGKKYLDKALELNLDVAKLTAGISLYYGSNGYSKNINRAIELITEAEKCNVEGASEFLEKVKSNT